MIELRLLGPFEASVLLPAGKPRALLARLLLDLGRVVAGESLVDALWGEDAPPSAPKVLQAHVSALRKSLGTDAIETRAPSLIVPRTVSCRGAVVFIGRLEAVPLVIAMAFFEGFIQRFMPYLAELAQRQGSAEMEYTDVHGVCDITHTQELFRALDAELAAHIQRDDRA